VEVNTKEEEQLRTGLRGGDGQLQGRVLRLELHGCLLSQLGGQAVSEDAFRKWSHASFMLRKVF